MRRLALTASALLLGIVAGCSSNQSSESREMPCNDCDYGYVPVKHAAERRVWCIQDGKTLDCTKNPAECPECRKHLHEHSKPPAE
jgi:hypothetical protein